MRLRSSHSNHWWWGRSVQHCVSSFCSLLTLTLRVSDSHEPTNRRKMKHKIETKRTKNELKPMLVVWSYFWTISILWYKLRTRVIHHVCTTLVLGYHLRSLKCWLSAWQSRHRSTAEPGTPVKLAGGPSKARHHKKCWTHQHSDSGFRQVWNKEFE